MAYDVDGQIADIREWVLDTDTTSPAMTDAQMTLILNHHYIRFWEQFEKRKDGTASSSKVYNAGTTASQSFTIAANVFRLIGAAEGSASGRFIPIQRYHSVKNRAFNEVGTVDSIGAAPTERSPSQWVVSVMVAPSPADNTTIVLLYVPYPADVTTGTDVMLLPYASARIVSRLAAWEIARILGRDPNQISEIIKEIPDEVKTAFSVSPVSGGGAGGNPGGDGGGDDPVIP